MYTINSIDVVEVSHLEDDNAFTMNGKLYVSNKDSVIYRFCFASGVNNNSVEIALTCAMRRVKRHLENSSIGTNFLDKIFSL